MGRLKNKTAIISGVTGGIGLATCKLFCEEGAKVIGIDISDDAGVKMESEFNKAGFSLEYLHCDVTSSDDIKKVASHAKAKFGSLDILVNNAGIILGKPLLETEESDWDRVHNVNLKSVFLMMRACAPLMKEKGGSIVNLSSCGGVVAFENMSAYGAAKAGVIMLSKVAAVDLAPEIRVNAVCPGCIDTQMPRNFVSGLAEKEAAWKSLSDGSLFKRLGTAEEIAPLILYLASNESSFMTGSSILIDGGWTV